MPSEVIERCNFKCQYCHYWRYEKYSPEMSIEEWKQALLSLKDFIGRYSIKFVGGEPFLKKGFVDLLEFCHGQALDWGVITNGFAFRSNITPRVVAAGPSNIDISVDSPDAEENDLVRGAPGSLENIEAGIRSLRSERDRVQAKFPIRYQTNNLQNQLPQPAEVRRMAQQARRHEHRLSPGAHAPSLLDL